ncbi:MAG: hypothetical protein JRF53_18605 [Deltaproteobacteria bacterium]|nr:hypothetical protein [Deltaproteobacteria bacterium]
MSWTHYHFLLKLKEKKAHICYMNEAIDSGWSTRQLEHQSDSFHNVNIAFL